MAAQVPAVQVIREYTPTPAGVVTPTLETVIVGPAYHIQDYASDKDSIGVGTYGDAEAASDGSTNNRPLVSSDVIVLADAPNNAVGALLDHDSVGLYMDEVYVELVSRSDGTKTTVAPNEDLFYAASGVVDFQAAGVRPGDRLVITDVGLTGGTVFRFIKEVGGYAGSSLSSNQCRTQGNITDAELTTLQNGSYRFRIERALSDVIVDNSFLSFSGNEITIKGGITVDADVDGDGVDETVYVNSGVCYLEYRSLRQDLAAIGEVESSDDVETLVGQIDERNPLAVALFIALQNSAITGIKYLGVTADDLNGGTDRAAAYLDALETLETDEGAYCLVPLTGDLSVITAYKASAEALSAAAISLFRTNVFAAEELPSTTTITEDSATGEAEFVAGDDVDVFVSIGAGFSSAGVGNNDQLFIVDGTSEETYTVLKSYDDDRIRVDTGPVAASADSKLFFVMGYLGASATVFGSALFAHSTNTVLIASGGNKVRITNLTELNADFVGQIAHLADSGLTGTYDGYYVITAATDHVAASVDPFAAGARDGELVFTARAPGELGNLVTVDLVDPAVNAALSVVVVGNAITVNLAYSGAAITSTADDVIAAILASEAANALVDMSASAGGVVALTDAAGSLSDTLAGGTYAFYTVTGGMALPGVAEVGTYNVTVRSAKVSVTSATAYTQRTPYRRLLDNSAAFLSATVPVVVSDDAEIPVPPGAGNSDYDTVLTSTISIVSSDNRLVFAVGEDLAVEAPESLTDGQAIPHYRVTRALTRAGQVTTIVDTVEGIASSQVVWVWPPEVLVSNVVNARTSTQNRVPGYYLAAAVGGMSAGLPPHQGFTNLGVAGIEKVYYSNTYFSRTQLASISNAGAYVVVQKSESAAPYCMHALTTDVSSLQTSEFMLVRNYHYVAKAYKAALDSFLGRYNVIDETLGTLRDVMRSVGRSLQASRLPRIGAIIRDSRVLSVDVLDGQEDTVEIVVEVTFPRPLNQIILRIRG